LASHPWTQRPYTGPADQTIMTSLSEAAPSENLHIFDLPYRFSSWAFDDPKNVGLWFADSGQLIAWAVMQIPFWSIDYALAPSMPTGLHSQVLEWADNRAHALLNTPSGLPCWYINAFSWQEQRILDLKKAGFACQSEVGADSWSKVFLERPADLPVNDYRISPGFSIRPLLGESEVAAYVELHRTVFESKNMTVSWRSRTLHHPTYRPDLDIVVAVPDGRLAAFCIGWLHQSPGQPPIAQIEPLGCHPDFRRYALGRLALAEGLRRLQASGASRIYVETDNYRSTAFDLYESFGFHVIQEVYVFRKDYG
jgi:mycothiol synthase